MLSSFIIRSAAAFGGAPFRLSKCTALGSAGSGAAAAKEKEEKDKLENENKEFQSRLLEIFK